MCTGIRFTDAEGNMYLGRNLDWNTPFGQYPVVTPRGFDRKYAYGAPADNNYAVIGMCIVQEGLPLYFDCGNDQGLAIAGLNFPGYAQYEEGPVDGKVNLAAYEFPLWIASNFSTVDDAEKALENVAIVAKPINDKYPVSLLHWIIGDKERSIVVEYMPDGMHIHHDPVDSLTNQPTFDFHMEHLRSYLNVTDAYEAKVMWGKAELTPYGSGGLMRGLPGSTYSPDRFVRVAYGNTHYPEQTGEKDNVTRLFKTLQSVAMIKGGTKMADGTYEITTYTGGFSTATNNYYYNTYDDPAIQVFKMSDADLDSAELQRMDQ